MTKGFGYPLFSPHLSGLQLCPRFRGNLLMRVVSLLVCHLMPTGDSSRWLRFDFKLMTETDEGGSFECDLEARQVNLHLQQYGRGKLDFSAVTKTIETLSDIKISEA